MTIRIVIDNEDAAEVKAEGSKLFWTANVYLNDTLISVEQERIIKGDVHALDQSTLDLLATV